MTQAATTKQDRGFVRGLGLFDSTMVVIGVMIGSGIFIVSADMSRLINSPGWMLMAWVLTGVLTITAALSYGELASMLPHAGGMYIYLREAFSPLWGFLYGWTFFTVIQTGTIAAVSVAFARFLSIVFPPVAESRYLIAPIHLSAGYAISLSTAQLVAIAVIVLLTWTNTRGLEYGKIVQNLFTSAKTVALVALILAGLFLGWNSAAVHLNFTDMFRLGAFDASLGVAAGSVFGLIVALCVAQSGSMFSADSWHDITIIAGEVRNPARNVPLAMALGCSAVIALYILANVAYLVVLPLPAIQNAPSDRVATAMLAGDLPRLRPSHHGHLHHDLHLRLREQSGAGRRPRLLRHGAGRALLQKGRSAQPGARARLVACGARHLERPAGASAHLRSSHPAVRQSLQQSARLCDFRGAALLHPDHRRCVSTAAQAAGPGHVPTRWWGTRLCRRYTFSARP